MKLSFNSRRTKEMRRRATGVTITELLISSLLMAASMAVLSEIMGLLTLQASRVNNRSSAIDSARIAIYRIASDVRSSRAFGDSYAKPNSGTRKRFPAGSENPIYGSGTASGVTFLLSPQTLIVQTPKFFLDEKNDPNSSSYNPAAPQNPYNCIPMKISVADTSVPTMTSRAWDLENLDTTVYNVREKSAGSGEWVMERYFYPGANITSLPSNLAANSNRQAIENPPQTVMNGISGPKALGGTSPEVFSYFIRDPITSELSKVNPINISDSVVDQICGIGLDLEFLKPDSTTGAKGVQEQQVGIHYEVFSRSNRFLPKLNYKGSTNAP